MDLQDEAKIEKILQDRRSAHDGLLQSGSHAYKAFLALEKAAFSSGELRADEKPAC